MIQTTAPIISIILPVYNVENFLSKCIDSILNQTYSDWELICVNDCSPDNSLKILKNYSKTDKRISIIENKENLGLGSSRDQGLLTAKGEYITFVDSDDYIEPNHLSTYLNEAITTGVDIVIGGFNRVSQTGTKQNYLTVGKMTPWLFPSACTRMFKRSFLQQNNLKFNSIRYYEDEIFNCNCLLKKPSYTIIRYCGYNYIENPLSITRNTNRFKLFETEISNYQKLLNEINLECTSEEHRLILEYVSISSITACLLFLGKNIGWKQMKTMQKKRSLFINNNFPTYQKNPYIGFFKLPEESPMKRRSIAAYRILEKLKLDKLALYCLSFKFR